MILADAVAAVTAEFPVDDASDIAETLDITSGGPRTDRDVEPALYASRELAVVAWHRETMAALRKCSAVACKLVDGPHLDKWHITVMDSRGTQRVAEPRWSVTSRIGAIAAKPFDIVEHLRQTVPFTSEFSIERTPFGAVYVEGRGNSLVITPEEIDDNLAVERGREWLAAHSQLTDALAELANVEELISEPGATKPLGLDKDAVAEPEAGDPVKDAEGGVAKATAATEPTDRIDLGALFDKPSAPAEETLEEAT